MPMSYYSHESPTYVRNRILDHIYHLKGMVKSQDQWEITSVFMVGPHRGKVAIKFRIFSAGDVLLVQLQRRSGDLIDYRKTAKSLISLMGDLMPERSGSYISDAGEEIEYQLDIDDSFDKLPPRQNSKEISMDDDERTLVSTGNLSMI